MPENHEMWKLIAIEWIDGSGKWTQVELLVKYLREELHKIVEMADFPQYWEPSAVMLEKYLRWEFWSSEDVWPYIASTFFAQDRYAASFDIRKWLDEWKYVISNRYTTSSMWHQAGKIKDLAEREKFLEWLENLEYWMFRIPRPDAVVYIDMPPKIAQNNVKKKAEREYLKGEKMDIHEADINHLTNSAEAYRYVADKFGWLKLDPAPNWVLRSIEENQQALLDLLFENWIIEKK